MNRREWERDRHEMERMEDWAVQMREEREARLRNLRTLGWGLVGLLIVATILFVFVVLPAAIMHPIQ